ncbi:MAG TPA: LysR substrate-binding domain-containing protein [Burkholderiales bacterium]|jgi:LysR family cys regulon transcriptional activator|nr:LysR substrate-binding domain-containing protein [Burkholderiales bacterium]
MNLKQLKALCEVVDRGYTISGAAHSLFRTQPSITRQIQELEKELGVELFVRKRNKILDMTPQGREVVAIARRMLDEARNMQRISDELSQVAVGEFSIATTHTQARYTLPPVIRKFMASHPRVKLNLRQGTPAQCCELVAQGKADIAICTETQYLPDEVAMMPCYGLSRSLVTPPKHPLLRVKSLTLAAIARYPIITYDEGFSARSIVDRAFAEAGVTPNVVLSAIDADVSKAYVEMGLGVAILATIAFDARKDANLRQRETKRLFAPSTLGIVVRRKSYLRAYMVDFMQLFAPALKRSNVDKVVAGGRLAHHQSSLPAI